MTSASQATEHGSESPSRFDPARWRGQVCRFDGSELTPGPGNYWRTFDRIDAGDSASYGDFTPDTDGRYFLSDFLSGSDYSGCLVERANYKNFLEDFGEHDGVHDFASGPRQGAAHRGAPRAHHGRVQGRHHPLERLGADAGGEPRVVARSVLARALVPRDEGAAQHRRGLEVEARPRAELPGHGLLGPVRGPLAVADRALELHPARARRGRGPLDVLNVGHGQGPEQTQTQHRRRRRRCHWPAGPNLGT